MKNFEATFMFDQTPQQVFDAVNNVDQWWSETIEGETHHQGDEFIYRHGDLHYSKQRLIEVIADQKVVWLVPEGSINFVDDKSEWDGTKVIFDISNKGDQTELRFTHEGLTAAKACFDMCSGGWNYYLQSLAQLITTGEGSPDKTGG
jgi:uncharacterized protein YndB with AHSA1/START domain